MCVNFFKSGRNEIYERVSRMKIEYLKIEKVSIYGVYKNECRVDEARCAKIPPGWAPGVLITGGLITLYYKDTFTVYVC